MLVSNISSYPKNTIFLEDSQLASTTVLRKVRNKVRFEAPHNLLPRIYKQLKDWSFKSLGSGGDDKAQ